MATQIKLRHYPDQRRDTGEVGQVVDHLAGECLIRKFAVKRQHPPARFLERARGGQADAAAGAGDERGFQASPGIEKLLALSSLINSSS